MTLGELKGVLEELSGMGIPEKTGIFIDDGYVNETNEVKEWDPVVETAIIKTTTVEYRDSPAMIVKSGLDGFNADQILEMNEKLDTGIVPGVIFSYR